MGHVLRGWCAEKRIVIKEKGMRERTQKREGKRESEKKRERKSRAWSKFMSML